jgi:hypothetical protein
MKEHVFREMVNAARDVALKYHDHQSLRDRVAHTLGEFVYGGVIGKIGSSASVKPND